MRRFSSWTLPFALLGGAASLGVFILQARRSRLHQTRHAHRDDMQAWESEGGNLEPLQSCDPLA